MRGWAARQAMGMAARQEEECEEFRNATRRRARLVTGARCEGNAIFEAARADH